VPTATAASIPSGCSGNSRSSRRASKDVREVYCGSWVAGKREGHGVAEYADGGRCTVLKAGFALAFTHVVQLLCSCRGVAAIQLVFAAAVRLAYKVRSAYFWSTLVHTKHFACTLDVCRYEGQWKAGGCRGQGLMVFAEMSVCLHLLPAGMKVSGRLTGAMVRA
jgi:hypothetical protein